MFDRWECTIPADRSMADAIKVECKISPGILTDLILYFPRGCQNLARCRVLLGEKPIMPRSLGNYVAAEDMPLTMRNMAEPIREDMPVLNWHCWNVDETYPHTLWLAAQWLSIDEPYEMKLWRAVRDLVELFREVIFRGSV